MGQVRAGADPSPAIVGALEFTEAFARDSRIGEELAARLMVVVEELVSNALRHGGGAVTVQLELDGSAEGVELTLEDDGAEFDPTRPRRFAGPDRETGGSVGLELVRNWADAMEYAREGKRNRLRLVLGRSTAFGG